MWKKLQNEVESVKQYGRRWQAGVCDEMSVMTKGHDENRIHVDGKRLSV